MELLSKKPKPEKTNHQVDQLAANPKLTAQKSVPKLSKALNPGNFDPDELCRRLELYKQQQKHARRLREIRYAQGLKAEATISKEGNENHQKRGSNDRTQKSTLDAQQKKRLTLNGRISFQKPVGNHPGEPNPAVPDQAWYRPRSAASDFAKTATRGGQGQKKERPSQSGKAIRASSDSDPLPKYKSARADAFRTLSGEVRRDDCVGDSVPESCGIKLRDASQGPGCGKGSRLLQNRPSIGSRDGDVNEDQIPAESGALKKAILHGTEYTGEYRQNWTEYDQQLKVERASLRKKLSKLVLPGPKKSEASEEDTGATGTRSRRRSSLMAIFK
ncbi:MAG: hypothetical protein Q9227_002586 [Pyrenula ochraceoflavens]